jgi:hypothetical protein
MGSRYLQTYRKEKLGSSLFIRKKDAAGCSVLF